jgi:hypothetical protein
MPETVNWNGASGRAYVYLIYRLPHPFNTGQNGNYIYTKVVNNVWVPIYIGQGDLGDRVNIDNHHRSYCLKEKGTTHVHAHLNENEANRTAEERDLLAGHPEAFEPKGCNQKL